MLQLPKKTACSGAKGSEVRLSAHDATQNLRHVATNKCVARHGLLEGDLSVG
jgi:hypothetical protein